MSTPAPPRPHELRLTMRVLARWREASGARPFPRPEEIVAQKFGDDWQNCLMIRVDPMIERSTFAFIGKTLFLGKPVPLEGRTVSACDAGTLLHSATTYLASVIAKRVPISVGGSGTHLGVPILYRSMLMPLSTDGISIDVVLGAANYREVYANLEEHPR